MRAAAAKSEIREVTKKISYSPEAENIQLNVPLIFVVQILFNLIVNAAQAMRTQTERAVLDINVTLKDGTVLIDISDNGPGIPDEMGGVCVRVCAGEPGAARRVGEL